jgi:SNF2 family DNA or RNA helicase
MNAIKVDYAPKTKRLVMTAPFLLVDIMRSFPSRRFEPKSKTWQMPIVKANVKHLLENWNKFEWQMSDEAEQAVKDFEALCAPPAYIPFPMSWFDDKKAKPLEHQWPMLDRGWNLKAYALFAAMGTGKTFVTTNMAAARFMNREIKRMAIICPQTLCRTWKREFAKWWNPKHFTIRDHLTGDRGASNWLEEDPDKLHILLISVEGLGISEKYFDAVQYFFTDKRTFCVVDESSRIKNPDAVRTKRTIQIGSWCDFRMVLNGTPIAKGIHDLWSQYEFLDPNIIGSGDYWAFKTRYVVMGGYENKQIIGYSNVQELMDLIRPYSLEVNKDVLKLPPKMPKSILIEPSKQQLDLFRRINSGGIEADGTGFISTKNVLEKMLRLQQVIGGFEPFTDPETDITNTRPLPENPKLDALMQVVEDHYVGSKFIIWARYVPEIQLLLATLRKKFGESAVVSYYGGTSPEDRALAEDRYCNDPTCRIVVGNPSAAGLGLTFISGEVDVMVYYSGTFAYIDRAQSEDRSHRIGQENSVPVIDLVMDGTLDVSIQESIAAKMDMDQFVKQQMAEGRDLVSLLDGRPRA